MSEQASEGIMGAALDAGGAPIGVERITKRRCESARRIRPCGEPNRSGPAQDRRFGGRGRGAGADGWAEHRRSNAW